MKATTNPPPYTENPDDYRSCEEWEKCTILGAGLFASGWPVQIQSGGCAGVNDFCHVLQLTQDSRS
jgi:hypothetical protein